MKIHITVGYTDPDFLIEYRPGTGNKAGGKTSVMGTLVLLRFSGAKKLSTTALSWQLSRSLRLRVMPYGCS